MADNEQELLSEQDELLLTEIKEILIKPLKISYQQYADEAMMQGAINQAEEILAKVKQHYKQKETQGWKFAIRGAEQKRLDRPDRENIYHNIREILREVNSIRNFGFGTAYNEYVDKILALLIPDIEEAKKQEEERILAIGDELVKGFRVDVHIFLQRLKESI